MKKLIALLSLLIVSAPTFAASIVWGEQTGNFLDNSGTTQISGSAFLYLVDTATASVPTFTDAGWDLGGAVLVGTSTVSSGVFDKETTIDYTSQWRPNDTFSTHYYVIIVTTETADALEDVTSGWYYTSGLIVLEDTRPQNPEDPTTVTGQIWLQENGSDLSKWREVPEPTALALLALGVAGVALRRRIR